MVILAGLNFWDSLVLDLVSEFEHGLILHHREIICWRIEIEFEKIIWAFTVPIDVRVEWISTIFKGRSFEPSLTEAARTRVHSITFESSWKLPFALSTGATCFYLQHTGIWFIPRASRRMPRSHMRPYMLLRHRNYVTHVNNKLLSIDVHHFFDIILVVGAWRP